MLLFIDNFDSFTFNIVQAFQSLGVKTYVVRNQTLTVQECLALQPNYVVIGPGPGAPSQAGISTSLIRACQNSIPLLGICLGHQALAEAYGGLVERAKNPIHGKTSPIYHIDGGLFHGLPQGFAATRYHSLIVNHQTVPPELEVTAWTKEGEVMALHHRTSALFSVQFHPESVLTESGLSIFRNFLDNPSYQR